MKEREDGAALRDAVRLLDEANEGLRRLVERTSVRKTRVRLVALRGRLYRETARLGSCETATRGINSEAGDDPLEP